MLSLLKSRLRLPWPRRHRRCCPKPNIVIKPSLPPTNSLNAPSPDRFPRRPPVKERPIRIATFNAAFFSMAPAVGRPERPTSFDFDECHRQEPVKAANFRAKSANDRPRSILKHSPLQPASVNGENDGGTAARRERFARSKLRVSINLPDNEISLLRNRQLGSVDPERRADMGRKSKGKAPMRHSASFCGTGPDGVSNTYLLHHRVGAAVAGGGGGGGGGRTMAEVLREVDADIVALQDVRAEEEREMRPLSDLAKALGMNYVFAESWAPEYGNAVLSRWPIRRWKVHKIFDDTDYRNVLKATIDVPEAGEVNFNCTLLDHLNEGWRMKQVDSIIRFTDEVPHLLAGCLNSLDESDYSNQRWTDIVKYYEELGKPTPKAEVMRFLKSSRYTDAKEFAGECEPVVVIAKGQSVQGTCKYGTRVDYILASPDSPYKFVPGSYSVLSSKGTSDHHIVKVDVVKSTATSAVQEDDTGRNNRRQQHRIRPQKVVKINGTSTPNGVWRRRATTDHNKQNRSTTFDS
ncbi:hypothetical protein MLD38_028091 [Melastoma candidum]|uniref:Uncharacterized protein n=1 Tax=Melastoma candidum TaxID=119954 RepID=A0ACB9MZS4_9MYRT|nr:hypothetical protein MLD38_028091 [Melastoma candidum]